MAKTVIMIVIGASLEILALILAIIALVDGFLVSGRDSYIYLVLNFVAGFLFIMSGIYGQTFAGYSNIGFGLGWIVISIIETLSLRKDKGESLMPK